MWRIASRSRSRDRSDTRCVARDRVGSCAPRPAGRIPGTERVVRTEYRPVTGSRKPPTESHRRPCPLAEARGKAASQECDSASPVRFGCGPPGAPRSQTACGEDLNKAPAGIAGGCLRPLAGSAPPASRRPIPCRGDIRSTGIPCRNQGNVRHISHMFSLDRYECPSTGCGWYGSASAFNSWPRPASR